MSIELLDNSGGARNGQNRLRPKDRAVHDWYRFVLSFPPHLVQAYVARFGIRGSETVLDPFCGAGTTLVECKKLGISGLPLFQADGAPRTPMRELSGFITAVALGRPNKSLSEVDVRAVRKKMKDKSFALHPRYRYMRSAAILFGPFQRRAIWRRKRSRILCSAPDRVYFRYSSSDIRFAWRVPTAFGGT